MRTSSAHHELRFRPGFTLIEMVLALGILSILLVAGQSAIRIAGHSLPDSNSPTFSSEIGEQALAQLASELRYAQSVTQMSANSITFTVAARGTDSSPETICYSWDGTPGDPLTRQYNSDAPVNVETNVNSFSLLYDKSSAPATTTYTTSSANLLYSYTAGSGAAFRLSSSTGSGGWLSQSFTPSLPANVTAWNVTKVQYYASQDNYAGGQFYVQIRPSSGGLPGQNFPTPQQTTVNGNSLPGGYSWYTTTFTNPVTLPAGSQAALTFQWISDAYKPPVLNVLGLIILGGAYYPPADIACRANGASAPFLATSSDGNSWSNQPGAAVWCYVYGTYTTPNPPTYNYFLQNVRASIQLGSSPDAAVRTGIELLNQPQVTGP